MKKEKANFKFDSNMFVLDKVIEKFVVERKVSLN